MTRPVCLGLDGSVHQVSAQTHWTLASFSVETRWFEDFPGAGLPPQNLRSPLTHDILVLSERPDTARETSVCSRGYCSHGRYKSFLPSSSAQRDPSELQRDTNRGGGHADPTLKEVQTQTTKSPKWREKGPTEIVTVGLLT